jgi:hypothetical protein
MAFIRLISSTRPPSWGTAEPVSEVPAPRGVTGNLCSLANLRTSATWLVFSIQTAAAGRRLRPDES